ncbi:MAG: J domain-containing protein [Leptolyngbyaceae cyanobacterium SM2_5_2]|nr:J domain-containing protein [Leptolyngbyaceae cyanobacterium SM2_5_2]
MRLNQGLFKLDFEDHHAVLGVPITADAAAVRKRYLAIARRLHPDSLSANSEADAQQASELLSKWVNPAYKILSQEKSFTEHQLVLKLKGQSLQQAATPPAVSSEAAQGLLKAPQVDAAYRQAVNTMAIDQYGQFDQVLPIIGQLSELNLVYLYRTVQATTAAQFSPQPAQNTSNSSGAASASTTPLTVPLRKTQTAIVESYMNRAQEFERDRDYSRAVLEMREALKTYPNSAKCHSYLASLYLKTNQVTMARVHAKRALDIQPQDEVAQAIQARLDKRPPSANPSSRAAKGSEPGSGGFFGLFGGKKK